MLIRMRSYDIQLRVYGVTFLVQFASEFNPKKMNATNQKNFKLRLHNQPKILLMKGFSNII